MVFQELPDKKDHMVAYFSAEYGLNEVLPYIQAGLAYYPVTTANRQVTSEYPLQQSACSIKKDISASA